MRHPNDPYKHQRSRYLENVPIAYNANPAVSTLNEMQYKMNFRELDPSNTRLNVSIIDYAGNKAKRDRAILYWKNRVI
jgi:hypothetical protein